MSIDGSVAAMQMNSPSLASMNGMAGGSSSLGAGGGSGGLDDSPLSLLAGVSGSSGGGLGGSMGGGMGGGMCGRSAGGVLERPYGLGGDRQYGISPLSGASLGGASVGGASLGGADARRGLGGAPTLASGLPSYGGLPMSRGASGLGMSQAMPQQGMPRHGV